MSSQGERVIGALLENHLKYKKLTIPDKAIGDSLVTQPFVVAPRYRLDDEFQWLRGIDP
ncbi:MAG: hypothetical protein F6J87_17760, partial [Spirulina sp. SIO3F2]|nr:hypothetical protein [Spirulina sp. SIO3F2]